MFPWKPSIIRPYPGAEAEFNLAILGSLEIWTLVASIPNSRHFFILPALQSEWKFGIWWHSKKVGHRFWIFSCEAQLNPCTFVSVCPSVRLSVCFKTEFLTVWSAYDNFWQLMTAFLDNFWQLLTTYICTLCKLSSSQDFVVGLVCLEPFRTS